MWPASVSVKRRKERKRSDCAQIAPTWLMGVKASESNTKSEKHKADEKSRQPSIHAYLTILFHIGQYGCETGLKL